MIKTMNDDCSQSPLDSRGRSAWLSSRKISYWSGSRTVEGSAHIHTKFIQLLKIFYPKIDSIQRSIQSSWFTQVAETENIVKEMCFSEYSASWSSSSL